jgi:hypothetical protein
VRPHLCAVRRLGGGVAAVAQPVPLDVELVDLPVELATARRERALLLVAVLAREPREALVQAAAPPRDLGLLGLERVETSVEVVVRVDFRVRKGHRNLNRQEREKLKIGFMPGLVVCISHATGACGDDVGRGVAERLGVRCLDDGVIAEAAEWADLDPAVVADAERRRPLVARILGRLAEQTSPPRLPTGSVGRALPSDADLRALITDVLRASAEQGNVVLVAHAASFALAPGTGLRVFVTASPETRQRRVAAARGLDERDAARAIRDEDAARADYLRRFYGVEQELPTHYDVVVSTDVLGVAEAVDLVVAAATV